MVSLLIPSRLYRHGAGAALHIEAELDHLAALHDVVLALDAGLARRAGRRYRAGRHQVVEGDDLGLDEALLEVGVDHAGRLRGGCADRDLPGAGFLRASSEEGLQSEGAEAGLGPPGEARLAEARLGEQFG